MTRRDHSCGLGISTTKKGPYIEQMWKKFIKLHIMADRKGKVVGFRVTSERTGNTKKFLPLVKEVVRKKGNIGLSRLRLKEGAAGHRAGHKPEECCSQL
ncbi:MAG: hypothetical protein QXT35_07030 [Conexivisphaerales archaeon]